MSKYQQSSGTSVAELSSTDASSVSVRSRPLVTLQDLLEHLEGNSQIKMLQSTANKLCEFLATSSDAISIETVGDCKDEFAEYLKAGKYKSNSIRSYLNYVRILLNQAAAAGWAASRPSIPDAWTAVFGSTPQFRSILRFLSKRRNGLEEIDEEDLEAWVKHRVDRGASQRVGAQEANWFRKTLVVAGVRHNLLAKKTRQKDARIRLEDFPPQLRAEVEALVHWKVADRVSGRPSRSQIRAATAKKLLGTITLIYGFAINIAGITNIETLTELVSEKVAYLFVDWLFDCRKVGTLTVEGYLAALSGALNQHPKYKAVELKWLRELIASLPDEDSEAAIRRKEQIYLSHDVVKSIPALIRKGRKKAEQLGKVALAIQVRDELMMKWLAVLPWRQRNIRELRIGGQTPNLYKAKISPFRGIEKYTWVEKAERDNPNTEFWQIDFTAKETKTGKPIHILLPHGLVEILEEYLLEHRGNLLRGSDPGNLFLSSSGSALFSVQVLDIVKTQTLRHGGRAVHPHLFRDIYAFMWVSKHPGEILTLSKLLWHVDLEMTVKKYARKFNESSALCRMEALMGE